MSKQKQTKQTAMSDIARISMRSPLRSGVLRSTTNEPRVNARETHEPPIPQNWPHGHVGVRETPDGVDECFVVTIHGVDHYLHSTTAYELYKMLGEAIPKWDKVAKAHGQPGVLEAVDEKQ